MTEPARAHKLCDFPRELRRRYGRGPTYSQLYRGIIDGWLPAERDGRVWTIREDRVPEIAEAFGLTSERASG